jgi:hypothetical protein
MKLPAFLAAFCLALAAMVAPPASPAARAEDVTFDIFYNSLADEGDWYNTPDYGYVWQPYVAYKNDTWRPYTDGYWAQTDAGWTWVSYENFGWAAYHYGRWTQLEGTGWVWVPGYEWGPGWVSWRQNDNYVGWAPIPPKRSQRAAAPGPSGGGSAASVSVNYVGGERFYEPPTVPITEVNYNDVEEDYNVGYDAAVDDVYDIGPASYTFVPVRYLGAPYLRDVIVSPLDTLGIIESTFNVTSIIYRRGLRGERFIYNGGPDFGFVRRRTERDIPRFVLDRRTDFAFNRGNRPFNTVNGNRFQVVAPIIRADPVNFTRTRPTNIKRNIDKPLETRGWRNSKADQQTTQRLQNKFQQEAQNAKSKRTVADRNPTPTNIRRDPPFQPQPGLQPQNRQGGGIPSGAAGFAAPGTGQQGTGLQPVNPANRGARDAADREARRNAQLQKLNERRAAQGQPPIQPNVPGPGPQGGQAGSGPVTGSQTRDQQRLTQQQQQQQQQQQRRDSQGGAQQRQQGLAGQPPQPGPGQPPQPGPGQPTGRQTRDQQRLTQQQQQQQQPTTAQGGGETRRTGQQQQGQQAAQERATRQQEAQQRAAQQREQQQAQTRQRQEEQRRQTAERGQAQRQQQQQAAAERQRAAAEARQRQAAQAQQQRAAQQQQRAAQAQQQRAAAAQAQAQQRAAAQAAQQRQKAQQQQQQQQQGGKKKRNPDGTPQG